ncbi:hypothetical protein GCM10010166_64050 [Couchioplanes caeruleus subsp. azureus]|nr:hypothetical protein GCM10010166_64050 [Couchioplanes caeruleus subsp. azureus]
MCAEATGTDAMVITFRALEPIDPAPTHGLEQATTRIPGRARHEFFIILLPTGGAEPDGARPRRHARGPHGRVALAEPHFYRAARSRCISAWRRRARAMATGNDEGLEKQQALTMRLS